MTCKILDPTRTVNTLQHTATHCKTLRHTETQCKILQHTATYCNTLQHTATRYNTYQIMDQTRTVGDESIKLNHVWGRSGRSTSRISVDLHENERYAPPSSWGCNFILGSVLRISFMLRCSTHTATHCNTLQHTAIHTQTPYRQETFRNECNTKMPFGRMRQCSLHILLRNRLRQTATDCSRLQQTATHCNTLQHTATHCNTLQHTAAHFNTWYAPYM